MSVYTTAYTTTYVSSLPVTGGISKVPTLAGIHVEAGLVPDSPVQPAGAFVLSSGTSGVLDTSTLGTSVVWTDLGNDVISFSVNRPSTREQGPLWSFQAGTTTILLDNSNGDYDPDNLASPYVTNGVSQLVAMVPVRIRCTYGTKTYYIYSGFADGWFPAEVVYAGDYAEMTLGATDAFKVLTGVNLPASTITGVGVDTGARIRDLLTRANWYTSADKTNVDVGNSTLQGTTLGSDALSLMQLAVDSEIGQLFVNGSGAVTFRARQTMLTDTTANTVQAVFGDKPDTVHAAGTELSCASITRANDDTTIVNDVQATREGSTAVQEVTDANSITTYLFPRTYSRSVVILQNDSDALNWGQWVLYVGKPGEDRIEAIKINPLVDPDNLWPQVLGREIGDRIQVWLRPPRFGGPLNSNPYFNYGSSSGWTGYNGTFSVTSSPPAGAPYHYAGLFTISTASVGAAAEESGISFAAGPSNPYELTAWVYTSTGSVSIGFDWTNSSGGYLSTGTQTISVPASTWTQVSTTQISDSGTAKAYPRIAPADGVGNSVYIAGVEAGNPVVKDCFIVGIQHDWNTADNQWTTMFTLSDASKYASFMTLDNSTTGKLNSNAVAF